MEQLISVALALENDQLSIEQFRSRVVEIICSLSNEELLNVALTFAAAEMADHEYDVGAGNILKP